MFTAPDLICLRRKYDGRLPGTLRRPIYEYSTASQDDGIHEVHCDSDSEPDTSHTTKVHTRPRQPVIRHRTRRHSSSKAPMDVEIVG